MRPLAALLCMLALAAPARAAEPAPAVAAPREALALRLEPAAPLTAGDAFWRSAVVPGWGQLRTGRPVRGATFASLAAAGVVSSLVLGVRFAQANAEYEEACRLQQFVAYDQARDYATARNWAIGLTAAVWVVGAVEAWLGWAGAP